MQGSIFEWIMARSDLAGEATPAISLVEIVGRRRVLIENHGGITGYDDKEIRIKTTYGTLCVSGTALELAKMTKEQVVITGYIDGVTLFKEVCG